MTRRRRIADLPPDQAAELARQVIELRTRLIAVQCRLKPGPTYWRVDAALDALHEMLVAITGRELDYRRPDLGLF